MWDLVQINEFVGVNRDQAKRFQCPPKRGTILLLQLIDERKARIDLLFLNRSLPDQLQDFFHLRGLVTRIGVLHPLGQCGGLVLRKFSVEHRQGLGWLCGFKADRAGKIGLGKIKNFQYRCDERSFNVDVNTPSCGLIWGRMSPALAGHRLTVQYLFGDFRINAGALLLQVQLVGNLEDGIPDFFGAEPPHILVTEEMVERIPCHGFFARPRGTTVGVAQDDLPNERFHLPIAFDKLGSQIIK